MNKFISDKYKINSLAQAVQFASYKMDESAKLMKEIKSKLASLKKENENLRTMDTSLT